MAEIVLDEELTEGLKQAKKTPRNFALIVKGQNPVKLLVQKKRFRDAELMKAKTEAKGNDIITGVLQASGSDFAFLVVGDAEPGVKTMKLKELISEQTDLTAKPRWELVKELPSVHEEEEEKKSETDEQRQDAQAAASGADQRKKQLADALKALAPSMQQVIANQPAHRDAILTAAGQMKSELAASKFDEAQVALEALQALLGAAVKGGTAAAAQSSGGAGKVSLVKLGKARLEWIAVRNTAVAGIGRLKTALTEEFGDDAEQAQALGAAMKKLDDVISELAVKLADDLDAILNADDGNRAGLIPTARNTLEMLTRLCESDPIVAALDDNEVIPGLSVVTPMRGKLGEISAALG